MESRESLYNNSLVKKGGYVHCRKSYRVDMVEQRLLSIKAQYVTDELTQIMIFVQGLEKFWHGNSETLERIRAILSRLRSRDKNDTYTELVNVLAKYLSGIREFSADMGTRGIAFYRKLFESALTAITHELDSLGLAC